VKSPRLPGPGLLFCPADRPDRYHKPVSTADVVVLDLEDAVFAEHKAVARESLVTVPVDPRVIVPANAVTTADHASSAPAQPTQRRYSVSSGIFPSRTGTSKSSSMIQSAPVLGHSPRVAAELEVVEHRGRLLGEGGLDQHLVAAHAVDVLDVDRAPPTQVPQLVHDPDHVRVDHPVLVGRC
jgi:hypothetical protein